MELIFILSDLDPVSRASARTGIKDLAAEMDFLYHTYVSGKEGAWAQIPPAELGGASIALIRADDPGAMELGLRVYQASPFCRLIYYGEGPRDVRGLLSSRPVEYFDWNAGVPAFRRLLRGHVEGLRADSRIYFYEDRYHTLCIPHSGIFYFTSRDRAVYLQTPYGVWGPVRRTLDQVEEDLGQNTFLRCHKSFLVRTDACLSLNKSNRSLFLTNGEQVPVSRAYWDGVSARLLPKP